MFQFYYFTVFILIKLNIQYVQCDDDSSCSNCPGIIVDTDCGGDDAMAISVLLQAEAAGHTSSLGEVVGFTTVTGNTGAGNASRNVRELLKVLGRTELPVFQGMEDGLAGYTPPNWYFGYDGLGDFLTHDDTKPITPSDVNPGQYLASKVHENPGSMTILCLGPLTNLAMAIHFNPDFINQVGNVVIMGGNYRGGGNIRPGVEANMFGDPDAAAFFFSKIPPSAAAKIILFPMEPIKDTKFPMTFRTGVLGKHKSDLMNFLNHAEGLVFPKYGDTWHCYDPTTASYLVESDIASNIAPGWVEVITQGPRGAMFARLCDPPPAKQTTDYNECNVMIVTRINMKHLKNTLKTYLTHGESSNVEPLCQDFEKTSLWAKLFSNGDINLIC